MGHTARSLYDTGNHQRHQRYFNRTLGGAVEWAQPGSASFEDVEFEGAAAARAAAIPVTLWFTIAGSPLA